MRRIFRIPNQIRENSMGHILAYEPSFDSERAIIDNDWTVILHTDNILYCIVFLNKLNGYLTQKIK